MDNHNHKGMMWMMLICCALPLVVLFLGGSTLFSGGYLPKVFIGAFAVVCVSMMLKGHGSVGKSAKDTSDHSKTKDKLGGGCCH